MALGSSNAAVFTGSPKAQGLGRFGPTHRQPHVDTWANGTMERISSVAVSQYHGASILVQQEPVVSPVIQFITFVMSSSQQPPATHPFPTFSSTSK